MRLWILDRSDFWGEGIACPYCLAHWLAFGAVAIYKPQVVSSGALVFDLFVSAMCIVALSTLVVGLMWKALIQFEKKQ